MIAIIASTTSDNVIGKDNSLPWHIPEDLKNFKKLTNNNVVIMGRKTYDSLPIKPLPNRHNIVISKSLQDNKVNVAPSPQQALKMAQSHNKPIFIIGGSTIYEQFMNIADTMFISIIKEDYEGDTYFPAFGEEWKITDREEFDQFTLVTYKK